MDYRIPVFGLIVALILTTGCGEALEALKAKLGGIGSSPPGTLHPAGELKILGVSEEDEVGLRDALHVRGLMRQGGEFLCLINTQLVARGETLMIPGQLRTYSLEVVSITEAGVTVRELPSN